MSSLLSYCNGGQTTSTTLWTIQRAMCLVFTFQRQETISEGQFFFFFSIYIHNTAHKIHKRSDYLYAATSYWQRQQYYKLYPSMAFCVFSIHSFIPSFVPATRQKQQHKDTLPTAWVSLSTPIHTHPDDSHHVAASPRTTKTTRKNKIQADRTIYLEEVKKNMLRASHEDKLECS